MTPGAVTPNWMRMPLAAGAGLPGQHACRTAELIPSAPTTRSYGPSAPPPSKRHTIPGDSAGGGGGLCGGHFAGQPYGCVVFGKRPSAPILFNVLVWRAELLMLRISQ